MKTTSEQNEEARQINEDVQRDNGMLPPVRSEPLLAKALEILQLMTDPDPCYYDTKVINGHFLTRAEYAMAVRQIKEGARGKL